MDSETLVSNRTNHPPKWGKKIFLALLLTALAAGILFPFMWFISANYYGFLGIICILYPLLVILAARNIFKAILHPQQSTNQLVQNGVNYQDKQPSKFSKVWPYLFLVVSLPAQYAIAAVLGFIFVCGFEGSGCPLWSPIPFLIVLALPWDYIFIKCSFRKTQLQKITFGGLFILTILTYVAIGMYDISNR